MSRAAFEAWAKVPPREFDLDVQTSAGAWPGQHDAYHVQCAWEAWQAAERATAQRCAEITRIHSMIPMTAYHAIRAEYPEVGKP